MKSFKEILNEGKKEISSTAFKLKVFKEMEKAGKKKFKFNDVLKIAANVEEKFTIKGDDSITGTIKELIKEWDLSQKSNK